MNERFSREFDIRWSELDPNGHMRHSAYLDYGAQIRLAFLAEHGLSMARMRELSIGPILFREEIRYRREILGGDRVRVDVALSGLSHNRKHWLMRHHIHKSDGTEAAIIDVHGAWMSLRERRVIPAPPEIMALVEPMPRTEDFTEFESRKA